MLKPGPWHYRSIPCTDTTVRAVTPRLAASGQTTFTAQDFAQSGVVVVLNTHLGLAPAFPSTYAAVTHYQNATGNDVMTREHAGDRVQVCFLGWPTPTQACDPDTDSRGRSYRVYDYRRHASYDGGNGEHTCGGA
jgi:hypothetical protein